MFFHHPKSEKCLRRMAGAALHGAAMEDSDIRLWPRIMHVLKSIGLEALLAFVMCLLVGLKAPQLRASEWQDFMLAGAVMLTSGWSGLRFYWLLQSSPTMRVLWHLPVAGRDICRWARRKFLCGALALLPRMGVAAWAWLGFPALETAWMQILWQGVLLWLVMLACVQLENSAHAAGSLLGKIWKLTLIIWGGLALYAWWWEKNLAHGQPLPPWVITLCEPGSWVLPAKWAMHAAESHAALVLSLACLAAGGLFWRRFPDTASIAYDRLLPGAAPDSHGLEGDASDNIVEPETAVAEPVQVLAAIQHAAASETALVREGWIEHLALALLRSRDRMLGPILVGLQAGWTGRWWKALHLCTALLLAAYLLLRFGTCWISAATLEFGIVLLPPVVVVSFTFPMSNSIPLSTLNWPLGQQAMPFFAGLPITLRDLLRVSFRITAARMVACLALALPVIAAQSMILNETKKMPAAMGIVVILAASWFVVRPAFIYYRLQQMSRPAGSHRLGHACTFLLQLPLSLAAVFSIVASVGLAWAHTAWLLVCLPCTACSARAIYALFHWRVRAQKVDWVSECQEQEPH